MKILDEEIPLFENLKKACLHFWFFWLLLILTQIMDSVSTIMFMFEEGIKREANPVIRWLAENMGIIQGVLLGKSLQFIVALCFSALSYKLSRAVLLLLISLNLLATYHNLYP